MAEVERRAGKRVREMSPEGVRWLTRLEGGAKIRAYLDSAGIPTVGVGQTTLIVAGIERRVTLADKFEDEAEAIRSFRVRLRRDEVGIDAATRDDIEQATFDAFVSARYNCGPRFDRSTAIARFNAREPILRVVEALRWWNQVEGSVDRGLVERRACEADLILRGIYRAQGERALSPRSPR